MAGLDWTLRIEFVKKLNATVTDIPTKLAAIPAAFL